MALYAPKHESLVCLGPPVKDFPLWGKEQEPKIKNNNTEETLYDPVLRKRLSFDISFWEGISATNSRQITDSPPFVELSAKQAPIDNTESIQGRRQFWAITAWNAGPESSIYCMPWKHEMLTSTLTKEQANSIATRFQVSHWICSSRAWSSHCALLKNGMVEKLLYTFFAVHLNRDVSLKFKVIFLCHYRKVK